MTRLFLPDRTVVREQVLGVRWQRRMRHEQGILLRHEQGILRWPRRVRGAAQLADVCG